MRRSLLLPLTLFGVLLLSWPLAAVAQDLDRARETVEGLDQELEDLTQRYEELIGQIENLTLELEELEREEGRLIALVEDLDSRLNERARQVYMRGAGAEFETLLAAEGPSVGVERASLFLTVQQREVAGLEDAVSVRTRLAQTRALTVEREAALQVASDELLDAQGELEQRLESAQETVDALELVASRQRQVNRGTQQGRYACPLSPQVTHFIDSWGFPRSGGRRHQGADIMGPMGSPVFAFTDGVISRHSNSRLGGISLYLRGDDGSTYFYTHLQGYASAGSVGNRVVAGEHIAFNGDTGNARGGAPHIHFERHPGGGSAVNPYPYLAAACF